ncbi:hypothetical protein K438DRAFT_1991637 [Mycena galopus ATCC 62051]|nr:hypothetical protein K438DRAFT_1991637 [Mycena galopus ATCC 62051]
MAPKGGCLSLRAPCSLEEERGSSRTALSRWPRCRNLLPALPTFRQLCCEDYSTSCARLRIRPPLPHAHLDDPCMSSPSSFHERTRRPSSPPAPPAPMNQHARYIAIIASLETQTAPMSKSPSLISSAHPTALAAAVCGPAASTSTPTFTEVLRAPRSCAEPRLHTVARLGQRPVYAYAKN